MAVDHPSPFRRFLRTWRRELIRGGVLFGIVLAVGLTISRVNVNASIPWDALHNLENLDFGSGGDFFGAGRETGDQWEFRKEITTSQRVWIRNTVGPIEVVSGEENFLEVIAEKSWRHSNPDQVQLVAVPTESGVTICALWEAREADCDDAGSYRQNRIRKNDVAVRFLVRLPRGVRLDASTVNGEVEIDGVSAPVDANTVNGRIIVRTAMGPINASTVNGSIEATMEALSGGDVELETVNGSVTAALPAKLAAMLDAETVNGRVDTDFPVQITGKISPRHLRGTIGTNVRAGATDLPTLKLSTVNGSIAIRQAHASLLPGRAPVAPRPPRAARVRGTPPAGPVPPVAPAPVPPTPKP
jgi:ribosomal protein S28E/S33